MRRVAVIGAGITGLVAARALSAEAQVTLFEADKRFGGHAHTVDVTLDGVTHGVDTGFLVFNHRTYPNLVKLFDIEVKSENDYHLVCLPQTVNSHKVRAFREWMIREIDWPQT